MSKKVSLTVHKNKIENRRKRDLAKSVVSGVEAVIKENDIRAYAFVGIAANGDAHAIWDTGNILPLWAFAPTVGEVLKTDVRNSEVEDGWHPELPPKG